MQPATRGTFACNQPYGARLHAISHTGHVRMQPACNRMQLHAIACNQPRGMRMRCMAGDKRPSGKWTGKWTEEWTGNGQEMDASSHNRPAASGHVSSSATHEPSELPLRRPSACAPPTCASPPPSACAPKQCSPYIPSTSAHMQCSPYIPPSARPRSAAHTLHYV
eukprot:141555-Chlamydomonas_euryale.AAC.1